MSRLVRLHVLSQGNIQLHSSKLRTCFGTMLFIHMRLLLVLISEPTSASNPQNMQALGCMQHKGRNRSLQDKVAKIGQVLLVTKSPPLAVLAECFNLTSVSHEKRKWGLRSGACYIRLLNHKDTTRPYKHQQNNNQQIGRTDEAMETYSIRLFLIFYPSSLRQNRHALIGILPILAPPCPKSMDAPVNVPPLLLLCSFGCYSFTQTTLSVSSTFYQGVFYLFCLSGCIVVWSPPHSVRCINTFPQYRNSYYIYMSVQPHWHHCASLYLSLHLSHSHLRPLSLTLVLSRSP